MLKMHPDLVAKFVKTILPVLVDVYAASVAVRVRTKVLSGLTKAVAFTDAESLKVTLRVSHIYIWHGLY
jgi:E3 ubiquitin-protein ligase TRIP12